MDVLQIQRLLDRAKLVQELVVPVLRHSKLFTAQQTVGLLRRLPHLSKWQQQRVGRGWAQSEGPVAQAMPALLSVLAARLAVLEPHCSPQQIAQGLWGLAAGGWKDETGQLTGAFANSLRNRNGISMQHMALSSWALAMISSSSTAEKSGSVTQLLFVVANRLATPPTGLPPAQTSRASGVQHPSALTPAPVGTRAATLSPRTVTQLSVAMHALGVQHKGAAQALATRALTLLEEQLQVGSVFVIYLSFSRSF